MYRKRISCMVYRGGGDCLYSRYRGGVAYIVSIGGGIAYIVSIGGGGCLYSQYRGGGLPI